MAQRGAFRTGRMGAEVHPDLCGLDLFLVRTHQDPQWWLEHHQLAESSILMWAIIRRPHGSVSSYCLIQSYFI